MKLNELLPLGNGATNFDPDRFQAWLATLPFERPGVAAQALAANASAGAMTPEAAHARIETALEQAESKRLHWHEARNQAAAAADGPVTFVCASAIGIYGYDRGDAELDESASHGGGFLADIVADWEDATGPAASSPATPSCASACR